MEAPQHTYPIRSALIVGVCGALGLLFNYFFWDQIPGIAVTLYVALICAAYIGIARYVKKPLRADVYGLLLLLMFFAAMISVRASTFLTVMNGAACLLLLALIAEVSAEKPLYTLIPEEYIGLVRLPFRMITPFFATCADLISLHASAPKERATEHIIRGVSITVPVIIVFALLFSSADAVFSHYIGTLFSWHIDPETGVRTVLVIAVAAVLTGACSYAMTKAPEHPVPPKRSWSLARVEVYILLSSINVLFFAFIAVQCAYLFGGTQTVSITGVTYAEYARRGFFELIAVAVFSYLILFVTQQRIAAGTPPHSSVFKTLSAALVVQVAIIMTSAFLRLSLYEDAFGFTTLRLFSHAFILFLAATFAVLLYRIIAEASEQRLALGVFFCIALFAVAMNALNPDAFIARKNLERYDERHVFDPEYMQNVSGDATQEMMRALDTVREPPLHGALSVIAKERYDELTATPRGWQSWNMARRAEERALSARIQDLTRDAGAYASSSLITPPTVLLDAGQVPATTLLHATPGRP